ncbi:hypothetical protein K1T71_008241 [Dendrolimus kikuchii]|uniref:Uncharacterized protein n=1 Tax=Dendrolimus kikuchii TaxID=765133 RepID=A0ACC1CXQ3_9NEOP|nr:hypothetical protein K1T71_008241 [Dendrolimus kikuchii]
MYKYILFSFLACIIISDAKPAATDISRKNDETGYKYYSGVGWVHHYIIPLQWDEARLQCFYEGGELMSPVNAQMKKVMSEIGGNGTIWTGVHATYAKGNYFSISGVPLSAMPLTWAQDEPDNENNNEKCMIMLPGYELDQRTQNCYKFHVNAQTWDVAFMICAAEGAHLAVIDSPGEQQVLRDLFDRYPPSAIREADHTTHIHLGFSDWLNHKVWMTINGKNIDDLIKDKITAWEANEPNYVYDHFGSMTRQGTLNDSPSHIKMAFICEFENNQI